MSWKHILVDANYNLGNQERGWSMRKSFSEKLKSMVKGKSIEILIIIPRVWWIITNSVGISIKMPKHPKIKWNPITEKAVDDYVLIAARITHA